MGVDVAISLVLALIDRSAQISALIQKAQAAGRTDLTTEEWKAIADADDQARSELDAAIVKAKSEGR